MAANLSHDDLSLDAVLARCLDQLVRAPRDKNSRLRSFTLSTVGACGAPQARTVVLRGFERDPPVADVHTDARSAKVADLRAEPRACLLFYDDRKRTQLRLNCRGTAHRDGERWRRAWEALPDHSKRDYATLAAPGTAIVGAPRDGPPMNERDEVSARENFRLLRFEVGAIDWLRLSRDDHARARFTYDDGAWTADWLTP